MTRLCCVKAELRLEKEKIKDVMVLDISSVWKVKFIAKSHKLTLKGK